MNEKVVKRLAALLSVKSIVTILLTAVFAYLAIIGEISQEFMMVYTVIIAFYFGTQTQKISDAVESNSADSKEGIYATLDRTQQAPSANYSREGVDIETFISEDLQDHILAPLILLGHRLELR